LISSLLWNRKQTGYQVPEKPPKKSKSKKEKNISNNRNREKKSGVKNVEINAASGNKRRNLEGGRNQSKSRTTTRNPERIKKDDSRVHAQRSATRERSAERGRGEERKPRRTTGAGENSGRRKVRSKR